MTSPEAALDGRDSTSVRTRGAAGKRVLCLASPARAAACRAAALDVAAHVDVPGPPPSTVSALAAAARAYDALCLPEPLPGGLAVTAELALACLARRRFRLPRRPTGVRRGRIRAAGGRRGVRRGAALRGADAAQRAGPGRGRRGRRRDCRRARLPALRRRGRRRSTTCTGAWWTPSTWPSAASVPRPASTPPPVGTRRGHRSTSPPASPAETARSPCSGSAPPLPRAAARRCS